ncbi:MAG TPA: phosphoglycerate kinase [Solirubrobacteraceae bacterium]|nr:phosphoglycerate kinase [Solirubrobacteraceae bacterium]
MRGLDDLDVHGRRVLVRVDFNVPLAVGAGGEIEIADDTRIRAALPTIEELRGRGARLVLVSHLDRPQGRRVPGLSMAPVAARLRELLPGAAATLAPDVVGARVLALTEGLRDGELLVLENVRFEPGETRNDPELARALAELADLYVNDAFGAAHRAHASTAGVAHLLPNAAGRLLEREVRTLAGLMEAPARPLVAVIGGSKVADKIAVIDRFLAIADAILIGGAMCFPFLAAQGHAVAESLCDAEDVAHARHALAQVAAGGRESGPAESSSGGARAPMQELPGGGAQARLELPGDLVIADRFAAEAQRRVLDGVDVPTGWMGLDIGPETAQRYGAEIARAGTVFWNGPMGAFELEPFAAGTRAVAEAVAAAPGVTVIGGGDSASALAHFGLQDSVDWLSTGGGATLELLEGHTLPGVQALNGAGVA